MPTIPETTFSAEEFRTLLLVRLHSASAGNLNIVAQADDQRRIEVIANCLPFWGGKQVAREGQAIHEAEQDKRRRHPELLTGTRCHFLVMAFKQVAVDRSGRGEGLYNPADSRCQFDGEASGNVCLCERAGDAWGRFGSPSMCVRDKVFVRRTFGVSVTDFCFSFTKKNVALFEHEPLDVHDRQSLRPTNFCGGRAGAALSFERSFWEINIFMS